MQNKNNQNNSNGFEKFKRTGSQLKSLSDIPCKASRTIHTKEKIRAREKKENKFSVNLAL
jgi:hypothetical protein